MKKTPEPKNHKIAEEMAGEYHFDYHAARANRFAGQMTDSPLVVTIDKDVAEVFTTSEAVNKALRALIEAMPLETKQEASVREK